MAIPTHLYRHFDESGKLLYVGISLSAINRLGQHAENSHWYTRIRRVEISTFDTRQQAVDAERMAVQLENPECNIRLRKTAKQLSAENKLIGESETLSAVKAMLIGRLVRFEATYSPEDFAALAGMTSKEVYSHIENGAIRTFWVEGRKSGAWPVKMKQRIAGWDAIDFIDYMARSNNRGIKQ